MKNLIFAFVSVIVAFTSCTVNTAESAKQDLKDLYEEVSANSATYTDQDWCEFAERFSQIDSLIATYQYTNEELREIGRMKGRCAAYVVKGKAIKAKKEIEDASEQVKGAIEGFMEVFQEDNQK